MQIHPQGNKIETVRTGWGEGQLQAFILVNSPKSRSGQGEKLKYMFIIMCTFECGFLLLKKCEERRAKGKVKMNLIVDLKAAYNKSHSENLLMLKGSLRQKQT